MITSLLMGSTLLSALAMAEQPSRLAAIRALRNHQQRPMANGPKDPSHMVYVITVFGPQFGAVDLSSGTFVPIGSGLPLDVGDGLVQGPGNSLLTLGFSGKLYAIDPRKGEATSVGNTGLGDCSTPDSLCGPNSALWIGLVDGHYYVTDYANNLYSLDPKTAATTLIGPTNMPPLWPIIPFSENKDGSTNVFGASLFGYRGKLYAYFSILALNFETHTFTPIDSGEIYEIDPKTGQATKVAPTSSTLSAIVVVGDTVYGFDGFNNQVVVLDVNSGQTTVVSDVDGAVGPVAGAAPARPAAPAIQ
jgi:hypothetical protein